MLSFRAVVNQVTTSESSSERETVGVFDAPDFDDHEQIVFCRDPDAGLAAIIAIHDTTMGSALGGCRMWPYPAEGDALADVLRLSRAMTFKHALAATGRGGGKSVIIGEATGGVTEILKRRIVLPLAGPLAETDHVLGHELVHAFQFDITGEGGGIAMDSVPTVLRYPLCFT